MRLRSVRIELAPPCVVTTARARASAGRDRHRPRRGARRADARGVCSARREDRAILKYLRRILEYIGAALVSSSAMSRLSDSHL